MLQKTDITVTFTPSSLPNSKSLGYGQINICGVIIAYSVLPSNYNLGIFVSYPSKPVIKNGVQERDATGKPKYFQEVYVADQNTRSLIDEAVLNAMLNKGVNPQANSQQQSNQGFAQPSSQQYNNGQSNPNRDFASTANKEVYAQAGSSLTRKDSLPF